jgi:hypothetical protein
VAALKAIWRTIYGLWMKFAYLLGTINRFIFMTIFYWVIIDVVNLVLRIFRVDLLDRRMRPQPSYYKDKPQRSPSYKNQF